MNTFTISHGYANDLDLWFGKIERKDGGKMTAGIEKTFKAMVRCAVGKNHTFVNMGTLANRTNVCHRTIERHIKILRDAGLINAVREEINGWKRTVYYFLAHPVIVKFRELRVGKIKPQQKKNETPTPDKPESTPDIEPETKKELSDGRDQDAPQNCYALDQQNVGNLSDYTFDRLNIETPSLSPSESAITHDHQVPPTWVKVRDRIIENDQLNLAAKYFPCIYAMRISLRLNSTNITAAGSGKN